ncbi:MAG: type II secretion system protein [Edaphobacter sp.]|uniref:type II secretion system protein n=1 Tax=Edaphobacter sp. TaxID=1934404 RepID=UPI002388C26D|nr:type II secretion system protein [Edaphobacter sp.]MDE1177491.1 type II secretion system protein [Edaphobacter sp.]
MQPRRDIPAQNGEEGYILLGAVVLVFLVLLALSVAAAKVSRELRRDREVEAIHRGNEYVRAIQLYYRKFGHYPGTIEQLEKSNNIRFLRQKYEDPMTGKPDWRIIHQGEAKTTVKGFFGQPLAGLPGSSGGLGSAASMVSAGQTSTVGGSSGSLGSSLGSSSPTSGGFSLGGSTSSSGTSGLTGSSSTGSTVSSSSGSSSGVSSQSATSGGIGGGGAIVGVGSSKTGESISVLNEQTTYQTWEFLYDPRIEQLKANAALLGGASSTGTNGFGSSGSSTSPTNSSSPFGSNNSLGSGSSFGSSSPTTPTTSTTPQ